MSEPPITRRRQLQFYGSLIFLGSMLALVFYAAHVGDIGHERAKFTIGYLTGYVYQKSGKRYNYRFNIQNTVYEGQSLPPDEEMDDRDGARFVVEYDSLNPEENLGHFAVTIPDSIRHPPLNGWTRPPFPVPARLLDRGKEAK